VNACLTIYGAQIKLPGGSASPPQAGSGTVFVSNGVSANPTANAGIWWLTTNDVNYSSPPAGFLRVPTTSISIIGVGCPTNPSNHAGGNICSVAAGSATDRTKPALWAVGAGGITIQNIGFNAAIAMLGAADSTGNRTNSTLVNFASYNTQYNSPNTQGNGPNVLIGGNAFNNYWDHPAANAVLANVNTITNTGLSRSANVVTATLSAANSTLTTGMHCGVVAANDSTFNGSFGYGVGGITVVDSTHITYPQNGANATSGGGYLLCDNTMSFVFDPENSPIGTAANFITNGEANNGGVRYWAGLSTGGLTVTNFYTEDSYGPAVWIGNTLDSAIVLQNVYSADPFSTGVTAVVNDSPTNSGTVVYTGASQNGTCCTGAVTMIGDTGISSSMNPLLQNQHGVMNGYLRGQTDAARHAPQTVRYANVVKNQANWTLYSASGGAAITTGIADNEGGTNAVEGSQTSGNTNAIIFHGNAFSGSISVGDWIYCGMWVRSLASFTPPNGAGYIGGGNPISCTTMGATGTQYGLNGYPNQGGDGEWEWVWYAYKITGTAGTPYTVVQGLFGTGHPAAFYSPVAFRIPSGTLSDGEVAQYVLNLRGYNNSCSVAQLCDTLGPLAHQEFGTCTMSSGTCSPQSFSHTLPSAPACQATWTGTGTLSGILKAPSTKSAITPSSSVHTDTAQVNWSCSY
jgi:hypothetical protein